MFRKLKNGTENMFVHRETLLHPRSLTIPTGNGKNGTTGEVGTIQARHQPDGKTFFNFLQVLRTEDRPLTPMEPDAASGARMRDDERELHDLSGWCR